MDKLLTLWPAMTIQDFVISLQMAAIVYLFIQNRGLSKLYHRLDALQFGTAKAIQAANGNLRLVNESANGEGDYSLDRS